MEKKVCLLLGVGVLALFACSSPSKGEGSAETSSSLDSLSSSDASLIPEESFPVSSFSPVEGHLDQKLDTPVYLGSLGESFSFETYFFDEAFDVPYVDANSFFPVFWNQAFGLDQFEEKDGGVYNKSTLASVSFSSALGQISFSDYDLFFSVSSLPIPDDILDASSDPLAQLNEAESSFSPRGGFSFSLKDYGAEILTYQGRDYVPFSYLETIGFLPFSTRFSFNGDAYFWVEDSLLTLSNGKLSDYGSSFYHGSYSKITDRGEDFSSYFYSSFLFQMDFFYGKRNELKYSSLDQQIQKMGLKSSFLSSSPREADEALAKAIAGLFGDGGHTAFLHRGTMVARSSTYDSDLQGLIYSSDYRYYHKANRARELLRKRGGLKSYEVSGNTAVIRFDSFALNSSAQSPSKENVAKDNVSTFALFYNSFQKIKKNPNIENVVFDVTLNGGGYATALAQALSFLSDEPIKITVQNPMNGSYFREAVDFDNDFDGDYSDQDSYQGQYKFYILTSEYSFSCANAFPCLAKEYGLATIIGETSGGGDCAVSYGLAADGSFWQMSGPRKLVHEDLTSFDSGAEVDYPLDDDCYYNVAKLDEALSALE